jgi:hypothetical protein
MATLKRPLPTWAALALIGIAVFAVGGSAFGGDTGPHKPTLRDGGKAHAASPNRDVLRAGNFRYVIDGPWQNNGGEQSAGEAACGSGQRVTGGGVVSESLVAGEQAMNSDAPVDDSDLDDPRSSDSNLAEDDGWVAVVDNTSQNDLTFFVYAICKVS